LTSPSRERGGFSRLTPSGFVLRRRLPARSSPLRPCNQLHTRTLPARQPEGSSPRSRRSSPCSAGVRFLSA
jgi:hypothetical protein